MILQTISVSHLLAQFTFSNLLHLIHLERSHLLFASLLEPTSNLLVKAPTPTSSYMGFQKFINSLQSLSQLVWFADHVKSQIALSQNEELVVAKPML